jgi:hypothetical protein
MTSGIDYVGWTVRDLSATRGFFVECLGWSVVGERPAYPAAFVSDGTSVLTLWQVDDPSHCVELDRRKNIGLHHLAIQGSRPRHARLLGRWSD